MKTRAAVAWEAGKPLEIETIELEGPQAGEVLLRNVATGVCHTDAFTLSGEDPEGIFPAVLGHEGGSIVEEIGEGVTSVNTSTASSCAASETSVVITRLPRRKASMAGPTAVASTMSAGCKPVAVRAAQAAAW